MSSIALFYALFTEEKEIRDKLSSVSGYKIVNDDDMVEKVVVTHNVAADKVKRAMFGPVSVFNKFTLEREKIAALLKMAVAEQLQESGLIVSGFVAQLIPASVTHVLKVGLFDDKAKRIRRAIAEGMSEKNALKLIKKNDASTTDWTDFLYSKAAGDACLYDILISLSTSSAEEAVELIMENYHKPAVLETEASRQAVSDMLLGARVELALVEKGYTPDVQCVDGKIILQVNKSVLNFAKLADTLTTIATGVSGVGEVEVQTGENYHVSIYRNQEFVLPPKVLLVDDEQEFVQTLAERLNTRNYGSYPVFDGEQAMELLGNETPDVMVLDLKMPGMGGVEVLRKTKEAHPDVAIIVLTGHGSADDKKQCMELGAFAYLNKPVDIAELTEIIDEAHKKIAHDKVTQA